MKQTTIRLPERTVPEVKGTVQKMGMTLNAYLISILWHEFGEKE